MSDRTMIPESLQKLTEAMISGEVKRIRLEVNATQTRFACGVDWDKSFSGSTIAMAIDRAWNETEKKIKMANAKKAAKNANFGSQFLEKRAED